MRTLCSLLIATVLVGAAIAPASAAPKASSHDKKPAKEKSLYARLGGKKAITAVVDEFVSRVAADTRINHFFANTNIPHLKMELVDQICNATGGPCKYTGKDMVTAHKGMNISDDDFNALVGDLKGALDKFKVGEKEQNELLGALAALKPQIVGQ